MNITLKQTKELLAMFDGEEDCIIRVDFYSQGHSGAGLYAYYESCPEEGAEYLGKNEVNMNKHYGSSFDSFLEEEGIKNEVEARAKAKRTLICTQCPISEDENEQEKPR